MAETFKCAQCGGEFEKEWSDEEAIAEAESIFGPLEGVVGTLVCDDCWHDMGFGDETDATTSDASDKG
jgi:hypothetical protein